MVTRRFVVFGMLAGTLLACSEDPRRQQTLDYLERLQPVLYENSLLAQQVLLQAATVYNGTAKPEALATAWEVDVVPMAMHVHTLAGSVEPPDHLAADHAALVQLWQRRADAYRDVAEGQRTANVELFSRAQRDVSAITLSEDQWVRAFNAKLAPMDLYLDLCP